MIATKETMTTLLRAITVAGGVLEDGAHGVQILLHEKSRCSVVERSGKIDQQTYYKSQSIPFDIEKRKQALPPTWPE
jgi:hypothetical protein